MQAYSAINSLLLRTNSTFDEFQKEMRILAIETETYLNLFLFTVVSKRSNDPQFNQYVELLLNFKSYTGKKSADINYVWYKDRKSILMHACQFSNKENIEYLLTLPNLNINSTDPTRKTALFYAVNNTSENNSNAIVNLLLDANPNLIHIHAENGKSILFEALEMKKYSTVQILLRRGADVNLQLKDSENSAAHQFLNNCQQNKQFSIKLLLLFLKYKANFSLLNKEGKNVFQAALNAGFDLSEYGEIFKYFQKQLDDYDKESLTTLNQQTKKGDNASQMEQIYSNICSLRVDFSETDFQQEIQEIGRSLQEISIASNQDEHEQEQKQVFSLDFVKLSQEIQQFSSSCQQKHRQNWINIHPFLSYLQKLVHSHDLLIQIIGSFATGLWMQQSNINLNLIPMQNEYVNFEAILQKIFRCLKNKRYQYGISQIFLNKNKINTIKLCLNQKYNGLTVDIAIFYHNNHNRLYVNYILQSIALYPQIKPLFFVFKRICQTYDLHDHLLGGLKTYTLFLMIYSIVKNLSHQNLGELFNHIAHYYGFFYQYEFSFKQEYVMDFYHYKSEQVIKYPKMVFNFIDPLNAMNNVGGKNTRVQQVQTMFKSLYFSLNQIEGTSYLQQLFQLHSIF